MAKVEKETFVSKFWDFVSDLDNWLYMIALARAVSDIIEYGTQKMSEIPKPWKRLDSNEPTS